MSDFQSVFKRKEVKYLLSREQYEAFLPALLEIAEIDRYGESDILSMYFDTPNYRLIRTSLEKPVYKEKFRLRTYGVPTSDTPAFAEIKKKYDGIVYKRRISLPYPDALKLLTDRRTGVPEQITGRTAPPFPAFPVPTVRLPARSTHSSTAMKNFLPLW